MGQKRKPLSLAEKARKCLREKELGKIHYKRSDALLAELSKEIEPGEAIKLAENTSAVLQDNFAEGKTQFFHGSFARRYELELVKA